MSLMDALIWILMPGFVAVGSGLLAFFVMQSRMDVAVAKEREAAAESRGSFEAQKRAMEITVRGAEEAARRQALDEFLNDIRVEQRHYVRRTKTLFSQRQSLVLEERIFFRNLPLSNWISHEVTVDEGADVERIARGLTVFDPGLAPVLEQSRALAIQ
jgi:hypothetical protein